jgi:hypothetical protein
MEPDSTEFLDQSLAATLDTETLQALFAKTSYQLRESRKALLQRYAADSEAALLERIWQGDVEPHPAYEHYLSALIIEQNREQIRAEMAAHMAQAADLPLISVHLLIRDKLENHYAARLAEPVRMAQDALLLSFDTGLMLEVRYFSRREYSIMWCLGELEGRLDTGPISGAGAGDGAGDDCWLHFSRLLEQLLDDPLRAFQDSRI